MNGAGSTDNAKRKLQVRWAALDQFKPYERNARTHSAAQIEQLARSLDEFGWTNPILCDKDLGIIAGHGRLEAAKKREHEKAPYIILDDLTPEQQRAYVIADNKLAENAAWNMDSLRFELGELKLADFDLSKIGFDTAELLKLLPHDNAQAADDSVEPPVNPASKLGDLWLLGSHRLLCGDSTSADDVSRLLNGETPNLMVTDPPYGVNYDPAWRERVDDGSRHALGKVVNDHLDDWSTAWELFKGSIAYIWHADLHRPVVQTSVEKFGFKPRAVIIWVKQHFVFSRGDYHWKHEALLYAVRGTGNWTGDRKQTTVWEIQNLNPHGGNSTEESTGHGTQKPVECMKRPIENNSVPGDAVYDPFVGSGSTIIAAEMSGRRCMAMEISPNYVDAIVTRWQNFTGQKATLDGDGRTFAEISDERYDPAANSKGSYEAALAEMAKK